MRRRSCDNAKKNFSVFYKIHSACSSASTACTRARTQDVCTQGISLKDSWLAGLKLYITGVIYLVYCLSRAPIVYHVREMFITCAFARVYVRARMHVKSFFENTTELIMTGFDLDDLLHDYSALRL